MNQDPINKEGRDLNLVPLTLGPLHYVRVDSGWFPSAFMFVLTPYPSEGGRSQAPEAMRKAAEGVLITESKIAGENTMFHLNLFAFCAITD